MKLPSYQTLSNNLAKIVRELAGCCEICNSVEGLQVHHCIKKSKSHRYFRWDNMVLVCLCQECHTHSESNPISFGELLKSCLPEVWEYVEKQGNDMHPGYWNQRIHLPIVKRWIKECAAKCKTLSEFRALPRWQDW